MLCRFVTTIEGKLMYCRIWYVLNLKTKTSSAHSYIDKNTSEMFCHDPENRWIIMPFPIIVREDIESMNFVHQLGIYFHTHRFCIGNLISFVGFLPHLLMVKYHVLSMKYFVDVTFFYTKVKEDFLFLWLRTYLRSLSCHNPQSAAQRWSRPSVVTLVVNITTRNYNLNA